MSNSKWTVSTLGNVCSKMFSGGTPTTTTESFWNGEHHWLSSGETRNDFISTTEKTITDEGVKKSSTRLALKGDIVMASAGQGKTRGQTSFLMIKTYINQSLIALRANSDVYSLYLYYYLKSQYEQLRSASDASSIRGSITTKDLATFVIEYPEYSTQQKIANLLFEYDCLLENNNRRIAILEEMAQRLYREWFVHFRFPGHEKVKMVESEIGLIPEGWEVNSIGNISEKVFSGGTPTTTQETYWNGFFSWLSSGETKDKFIVSTEKHITEEGIKNSSTRLAKRLDIVVASAGQGKTRGQTSLLLLDTYINQSVISIRVKDYCKAYAIFNISSRYDELRHISDASSIRGSLTTQTFNSLPILLPDTNVLQQYNDIIMSNIFLIENLRKKNENLCKTRDLLLPRLISGDIDVSELEMNI